MSLFSCDSTAEAIKFLYDRKKDKDQTYTYGTMASESRLPNHLISKAINQKANLSQDQLYLICKSFKLSDLEMRFLLLTLDMERTGVQAFKVQIQKERNDLKRKGLEIAEQLDGIDFCLPVEAHRIYYTNPVHQLCHMALDLPLFQRRPELLMREFGINDREFSGVLDFLVTNHLVVHKNERYFSQHCDQFLKRIDPFFSVWKEALRRRATIKAESVEQEKKLEFTVLISCSETTRKAIRLKILEFIKESQEILQDDIAEEMLYLGIDFFPWLDGKDFLA